MTVYYIPLTVWALPMPPRMSHRRRKSPVRRRSEERPLGYEVRAPAI